MPWNDTNPEALSVLRSDLKAEATCFAGQSFDRQVGVWRERAAKARENLPPGASADEVMALVRRGAEEQGES